MDIYFLYASQWKYYGISATNDFMFNYMVVVFVVPSSCVTYSFITLLFDRFRLELNSCITECPSLIASQLLTYFVIGVFFNAVLLLILCGYTIILAVVASPFHAVLVLILYLFWIYVFVKTVSDSMKKGRYKCVIIAIILNIILSVLMISSYFIMVTLIGEYNQDEGLWSVVGGLLPVSLNILLGYFIREIVNLLPSKVKND